MNRNEILDQVRNALADIIDNQSLELTEATALDDVKSWDSINHIKLLFALEAELGVHFEVHELAMPDTVGALIDLVQSKL